jgi:hypothetical protein
VIPVEFHHYVRIRPANGDARVLDLWAEFPEMEGPTRTVPNYRQLAETRDDVNRARRQTRFGVRASVDLTLMIFDRDAHESLSTIVTALLDDETAVDLSLDAGQTWREVVMVDGAPSPQFHQGKLFLGASYQLKLECVEPLESLPTLALGGW